LPPKHWPADCGVAYIDRNDWGNAPPTERRQGIAGVRPVLIVDPKHPCCGAYGLIATRAWKPFEVIGEYVGRVEPPAKEGDYVIALESDITHAESLSLDAADAGNELRFTNDFRGLGAAPNVDFQATTVSSRPVQLLVVTQPVATGDEFLVDYGAGYWLATTGAVPAPWAPPPPPSPLTVVETRSCASSDSEREVTRAFMLAGLSDDGSV